jgi:hypothetical protein
VLQNPTWFYPGSDQISSGGAIWATTRIMLGYDRVVAPNVTLGGKLGAVIAGKALRMKTDRGFMFFHGEVRASLWIGSAPFTKKTIRPYLFLSAGLGEADGKITVDYIQNVNGSPGTAQKAAAWKRSGNMFVGPGVGLQYPIAKNHGPTAEFRFTQYLSPSVPVVSVGLGYLYGF